MEFRGITANFHNVDFQALLELDPADEYSVKKELKAIRQKLGEAGLNKRSSVSDRL